MKLYTYGLGSEPRCIRNISVFSQPESPLARCLKVFGTNYQPEFTLALYSVSQPEVAMFIRTYTNVSALSARSHQLYQNANIFGLERSFSSAPTVQQFEICIQRRSRSQANERSDFRIAPFSGTPASLPQRTSSPADQFRFAQPDHQSISPKPIQTIKT